MLTFIPLDEIEKMEKWTGQELNTAKTLLAYELTKLVHGEEEAKKCDTASKSIFTGNMDAIDMPKFELTKNDFSDGKIELMQILAMSKLCSSKSDARRTIEQGGVLVDDKKITDVKTVIEENAIKEKGVVIKKGKKNFIRVVLSTIFSCFF